MIRLLIIGLLGLISLNGSSAIAQSCSASPAAVQILGSGGPRINPLRASSSYLLWIDGRARVLVDMGGGAHHRFGQSLAKLEDLWMVGISHLHPDHVSDLPAFLWLSHEIRKAPLIIFGPSGNDAAPDFSTFLSRLFDEKTGAFPVLGSALSASQPGSIRRDIGTAVAGGVRLDVRVVDAAKAEPSTVLNRDGMTVTAQGIPHGNMPTLAYRVQTGNVSVVFSSDQNGTDPKFTDFAKGAKRLDHASCRRAKCTQSSARDARSRGPHRARGGCRTAHRQSYRPVRSRCGHRRAATILHRTVYHRGRYAMHAGAVKHWKAARRVSAVDPKADL